MRGCAPASDPRRRRPGVAALVAALVLAAAGCSTRVLRVVDPEPAPAPLLVDLVGWWTFDQDAGGMIAHDLSGNGNDGTLMDADPATAWVPGRVDEGLELRGASYALVPRAPSIDAIVDQVTVSAWIYLEGSVVDYTTAISRELGASIEQHYHLSLNMEEKPSLYISTLDPNRAPPALTIVQVTGPAAVPRFTWVHLAGTYDGKDAHLYVNSSLVGSLPITGPFKADTTPLILGGNGNGAPGITERFAGRVDEIMLYKRALAADEISQLYNGALFAPQ